MTKKRHFIDAKIVQCDNGFVISSRGFLPDEGEAETIEGTNQVFVAKNREDMLHVLSSEVFKNGES